jgi:hypothetical protein
MAVSDSGSIVRCRAIRRARRCVSGTGRDANSTSGHGRGQVPARQCKRSWSTQSSTGGAARRGGAWDGPLFVGAPSCGHKAVLSSANTVVARSRLPNLRYGRPMDRGTPGVMASLRRAGSAASRVASAPGMDAIVPTRAAVPGGGGAAVHAGGGRAGVSVTLSRMACWLRPRPRHS